MGKYEMSNRMLIEQTFQQTIPNQYITTTILPPLRGDPTQHAHPARHAAPPHAVTPSPYGPPLPPMHTSAPAIPPTPPSFYTGNEAGDREPFSNELNENLINALKNEI